jgi:hypothetical protein
MKREDALGPKPPLWLTTSETYSYCTPPWHVVAASKWRFLTHVPHNREYLGALRGLGKRGFPYMTFYQTWIYQPYQGVRMSEHPEWLEIDEHGRQRRTGFWESEDAKNMYCTCANTRGYRESLLAYLEHLMDMGAGGIFLDNVHPGDTCWGEKYGVHKHLYPTQREAFAALMKEAQALIRRKDPEGALLVNSADPLTLPAIYWPWVDCEMSESFICTWVSKHRWGDWHKQWNGMDRKLARWMRAGKQVCCLSYVGHTEHTLKDDCYFCYASARLMNMIWQAGNEKVLLDPELIQLYQIETGQPAAPERTVSNGIHYRVFANAVVAANPTGRDAAVRVEGPLTTSKLLDLYSRETIKVQSLSRLAGAARIVVPRQSGRVYLFEPETVEQSGGWPARHSLVQTGYELTLATEPPLGKTRFLVDGIPLWTHSGRWTTRYEKGERYGTCMLNFDRPGRHRVEALDLTRKALVVAGSYLEAIKVTEQVENEAAALEPGAAPRLGTFMDPSNPGKFMEGAGYRFAGWKGAGTNPKIDIDVRGRITLTARYRRI